MTVVLHNLKLVFENKNIITYSSNVQVNVQDMIIPVWKSENSTSYWKVLLYSIHIYSSL